MTFYRNLACILLCVFLDISANRVLGVLKLEQRSGKCNGSIRTERAGNNQTVYPSRAESVLPEIALISVELACKQAFCGTWTPSHTVTLSHREPVRRLVGSTDVLVAFADVRSGNQFWQIVPKEMLLPFYLMAYTQLCSSSKKGIKVTKWRWFFDYLRFVSSPTTGTLKLELLLFLTRESICNIFPHFTVMRPCSIFCTRAINLAKVSFRTRLILPGIWQDPFTPSPWLELCGWR